MFMKQRIDTIQYIQCRKFPKNVHNFKEWIKLCIFKIHYFLKNVYNFVYSIRKILNKIKCGIDNLMLMFWIND